MIVYIVHALRHGDKEKHSVIVAAVEKKQQAFDIAINYEWYRGGKYGCVVYECDTDNIHHQKMARRPFDKTKGEHNAEIYNEFE
jgi:translation initiation factor 1 (eIF-1/SUI1)